jgi:homogentisate 1,2-dioxygenase
MFESSRSYMYTDYALSGCGTHRIESSKPEDFAALPDRFSAVPGIKRLLASASAEKEMQQEQRNKYYQAKQSV